MQSSYISSIKNTVSDKNYWLLILASIFAGILTYLIATAIWFGIAHNNWLEFPQIGLACIVHFVLGTMIATPFIKTKKSSAFSRLYIAIAISFIVITLATNNISSGNDRDWILLFTIGWCIITVLPVYILCYFAKKLLK